MKINFHELNAQYIAYQDEINLAIQKVLNSSQFIMGEEVFQFENELAQYLDCNHVISCANGTDALTLALMAIDLKVNDEVITTPLTFISTAEAIILAGAKPLFADIQRDTYHIDPIKIEEKITEKTRAIIPVSLYGQPADMQEINAIAEEASNKYGRKIYVIEDAAQSLGAEYRGKKSANLSDMACISFFPTKPLGAYGDGGAITVKENELAEKIKSLRVHGQIQRYQHKYIGCNSRLDTLQAAILRVKLKYFTSEIKQRQIIANYYHTQLAKFDLILPKIKQDRTSVYAQYSIRSSCRTQLLAFLKHNQIPTAIHYPQPLHLQECFHYLGYNYNDFPITEKIASEICSLPMSAFITQTEQNHITSVIQAAFEQDLIF